MLEVIVDAIAAKVIEKIYDDAREVVAPSLSENIATLSGEIAQIAENVEQQMLAPLRAGMTFVQLNEWERARDEFVRAEATDNSSPVARAWLGIALIKSGQPDIGAGYIRRSILANPFLSRAYRAALPEQKPIPSAAPLRWTTSFPPTQVHERHRRWGFLARIKRTLQPPTGAVAEVIGSARKPLVRWWEYVSDVRKTERELLTSLDNLSGDTQWSFELDGELLLVTPELICVKDQIERHVRLLDAVSGTPIRTVTLAYFGAAYHPNSKETADSMDCFRVSSLPREKAYEACIVEGEVPGDTPRITTNVHLPRPYEELFGVRMLSDRSLAIRIRNRWEHWHAEGKGITPSNQVPTCELVCSSTVDALDALAAAGVQL